MPWRDPILVQAGALASRPRLSAAYVGGRRTGGTTNIDLTGDALAQSITGNTGNNVISDGGAGGAGGADTMSGLGRNDTYIVDNAGDVVDEAALAGTDRVATKVSYTLTAGQFIETLTPTSFSSTTNIDLAGNVRAQAITRNAGDNVISDGGGASVQFAKLSTELALTAAQFQVTA